MSAGALAGRASSLVELITTWICRAVALSLTWWAQVLAGAVVLGVAPATLTLYHQVRIALDDRVLPGYYRASWRHWRRHFVSAQQHLLVPVLTVVVLWFYLRLSAGTPVTIPLTIVTAVYLCWLMLLPAWLTDDAARLGDGVLARWARTWQLLAVGAAPSAFAGLIAGGTTAVLAWQLPGVVALFCPTGIAVLATLARRRTGERVLRLACSRR